MGFIEHTLTLLMMSVAKPFYLFVTGSNQRYFFLYILVGLLLAWWWDGTIRPQKDKRSFWTRLIDRNVWLNKSAQNDYLILVVNAFLMLAFLDAFVALFSGEAAYVASFFRYLGIEGHASGNTALIAGVALTVTLFLVKDFMAFFMHWLLHVNPVLWEFHKVHHSAEQLNFLTSERSHPVDYLVFVLGKVITLGVVNGLFIALFGDHLSVASIMGANIFVVAGNLIGGALRHSPFALGYGERLEKWLVSPAMHHIHHSAEERHFDRNMGGTLSIWDRMFGTWMPSQANYAYEYGLGDEKEMAIFRQPTGLYFYPFVRVLEMVGIKPDWLSDRLKEAKEAKVTQDKKAAPVEGSGFSDLSSWWLLPVALIFLAALGSLNPLSFAKGRTGQQATQELSVPVSAPVRQLITKRFETHKPSVFLEDLTSAELHVLLDQGVDSVLIPIGGTEQNGLHMVLGKHNFIVRQTARRIAQKAGHMLVAPVMRYVPEGDIVSREGHMAFSGTLSVRPAIFEAFLEEAVFSLKQHGFKKIYLLGDSGSTQRSQKRVADRLNARWQGQGIQIVHLADYYAASGQKTFLRAQGNSLKEIGNHAGIRNTSELLFLKPDALRPQMLDLLKKRPADAGQAGHSGDPWKARKDWGEKLVDLKVNAALRQIQALEGQG